MRSKDVSPCVAAMAALDAALAKHHQPMPAGWFSVASMAEEFRIGNTTALRRVAKMVSAGIVESGEWRNRLGQLVRIYRLKA